MTGPKVNWPDIVSRVSDMLEKEIAHCNWLKEQKADPFRVKKSEQIIMSLQHRYDEYRKMV